MTKYLISFPAEAMVATGDELAAASVESRNVIEEAKAAGVYVFGGGINDAAGTVLVSADGSVRAGTYPGRVVSGGFTVLELPDRASAEAWARKLAAACRCAQELREFGYDPQS